MSKIYSQITLYKEEEGKKVCRKDLINPEFECEIEINGKKFVDEVKLGTSNYITYIFKKKYTDLSFLFSGCKLLKTINLEQFDSDGVSCISYMFYCCTSLNSVNLSTFDTSNVKYMSGVFEGCSSIERINLDHFDTSKTEYMDEMFSGCTSLKTLYLSNFNCDKISCDEFMKDMFKYCKRLKKENVEQNDSKIENQLNIDLIE